MAGISKSFLSDIENDKRNISSESALKIADALGISLDYLLRGETGERERQRQPVTIPPELSKLAEELELSYSETLTLLEAHEAVVRTTGRQAVTAADRGRVAQILQGDQGRLPRCLQA